MSKTIVFANHKGGVGKTTSCLNIGMLFAKIGYKVLLVDLDPQANLTQSLGVNPYEVEATTYHVMSQKVKNINPVLRLEKEDCFISLIPSIIDLSVCEIELTSKIARETILKRYLSDMVEAYDYILIDVAPSLGNLTINALAASDYVLIPVQAQFLAYRGLQNMFDVVDMVKQSLNPKLSVLGVFLTQFDRRTNMAKATFDGLKDNYGDKFFDATVRFSIAAAEAPALEKSLVEYSPNSSVLMDYVDLSNEILTKLKNNG